MNPLGIIAGLIALVMAWALISQIRAGEFRFRRGRVRKADNPQVFWLLAAVYAGIMLYVGSFVFLA